jgi:putative polyhydroxyalkanoate system protein
MATIDITRSHSLGKDGAREMVNAIVRELKNKIDIKHRWEGDELKFEGSGAKGTIQVDSSTVRVAVDLNFLLRKTMKGTIKEKINEYLEKYLG